MTSRKGFHKEKDKRLFANCRRAAGTQSEDRPSGLVAGHWPHRQYGRSTRRGSEGMRGMPGGKKRRGRGEGDSEGTAGCSEICIYGNLCVFVNMGQTIAQNHSPQKKGLVTHCLHCCLPSGNFGYVD